MTGIVAALIAPGATTKRRVLRRKPVERRHGRAAGPLGQDMAEEFDTEAARRPVPRWLTATPIAHRGLHALPDAPENSLAAFAAAVDAGYPIELDVRLLADGRVAVFHDHDLVRLTGVTGPLEARSAGDLRPLRLLGTDERIPLLPEVLDRVAGRIPLLVEIKPHPGGVGPLEQATLRAVQG